MSSSQQSRLVGGLRILWGMLLREHHHQISSAPWCGGCSGLRGGLFLAFSTRTKRRWRTVKLDPLNIGLIVTTLVTVLAGWASQRAATKTSRINAKEQAEIEAYSRAREMDNKTITRQNEEIDDLIKDNRTLRDRVKALEVDLEKSNIIKRALINRNVELQDQLREKTRNEE